MTDETMHPWSVDPMAQKDINRSAESKTEQQAEDENGIVLASEIKNLLHTYGNPADSTEHARYAENIKSAIAQQNKESLIENLKFFGNAHCNQSGEQYKTVEMFCSMESNRIIASIQTLIEVPWQGLTDKLEINSLNNLNKPEKKPIEITQEQRDIAKKIVDQYVTPLTEDQGFDEETKEKLAKYVLSNPLRFHDKGTYEVTTDGSRITFRSSFPNMRAALEQYVYLDELENS